MGNFKIIIHSFAHGQDVQAAFFKLGYKWPVGDFTYRQITTGYIFAKEGALEFADSFENWFFDNSNEIRLEELENLVLKKSNDDIPDFGKCRHPLAYKVAYDTRYYCPDGCGYLYDVESIKSLTFDFAAQSWMHPDIKAQMKHDREMAEKKADLYMKIMEAIGPSIFASFGEGYEMAAFKAKTVETAIRKTLKDFDFEVLDDSPRVKKLLLTIEAHKECFENFIPEEKWDEATKFLSTHGSGLAKDILKKGW